MSASGAGRLGYAVLSATSSDAQHPSLSSPHGWQSARQCSYPQSLLLWLGGPCEVRKVQLLSHQSKIARTVELYAATSAQQPGRPGRAEGADWSRLGFFSLDANEKSAYKARELKSVPLSCECEWLRIVLKACHVNPLNADRQVGIVALHVMGQQLGPSAEAFAVSSQRSSDAPSSLLPQSSLSSLPSLQPPPHSAASSDVDVATAQYLSHLQQLKAAAVDADDFDAAKLMKARIDRLLAVMPGIAECERRKRDAIAREDYDEAKQCKKEADRLREAALRDRPVAAVEERKEDRAEPLSQRGRRRESRHVVDMPQPDAQLQQPRQQTPAPLSDDDRPIRPAKQQSEAAAATRHSPTAADDRPSNTRTAKVSNNAQPASSDEENSFPVSHAAMDERPLRPAKAPKAAADDQQPPTVTGAADGLPPRPAQDPSNGERALPAQSADSSADAFDASEDMLPPPSTQLPAAEPLSSAVKAEAEPLIALLGIELTQSLYSRHWQQRAEAVQVVAQLVADEASPVRAAAGSTIYPLLRDMARVLQRTLTDKAAQVFIHACGLLEVVMSEAAKTNRSSGESAAAAAAGAAAKEEVRGLVEAVSRAMADRLSSSNTREREQASQILTYLALHKASPAATVPAVLLAPLKTKEKEHYTPLRARCVLLLTLVQRIGLHDGGGLSLAALMKFAVLCLSHRDAGVRDAACSLVALVCQQADRKKVDALLKDVPASTLASLDQRIADVKEGRHKIAAVEAPTRPFDDKHSHHAAHNTLSPRGQPDTHNGHGLSTQSTRQQPAGGEPVARTERDTVGRKRAAKHSSQPSSEAREVDSSPRGQQRQQPHSDAVQPHQRGADRATERGRSGGARQGHKPNEAADKRGRAQPTSGPADRSPTAAESQLEDTYSDEEYDGEQQQQQHQPTSAQPRQQRAAPEEVPNAGSPSHYKLNHALDGLEPSNSSGQQHDDTAATVSSAADTADETDMTAAASEAGAEAKAEAEVDGYPLLLHKCQFCGLEDESFTEDLLDLHYWQACPMLQSCPHCEQVVEIAALAEHLLSECEGSGGGQWAGCSRCGWVVEAGQLSEHEEECGGVRAGWVVCQLCCKDVEGSEDGWRQHLLVDKCPSNGRTNGTELPVEE